MASKPEIQVSIREIKQISFNQKLLPVDVKEIKIGKNLNLSISFNLSMDLDSETFKVLMMIKISIDGFNDSVIEFETETSFGITNLKEVAQYSEKGQVQIDDELLNTLLRVCIGTTRGMLVANTKGTAMSKFPLPILNTNDIVEQMKSE